MGPRLAPRRRSKKALHHRPWVKVAELSYAGCNNCEMPGVHVFVDETKEKGYLVTVAALLPGDLVTARRVMRGLVMPRQRRVQFTKESDPRRKQILDCIGELQPKVTIYDGSAWPRRRQREACLHAMVEDLAVADARMLVLEKDESVEELDKRLLYRRCASSAVQTP
jgi:hypothetical protein